jgi:tripeptide aminopeptidase
VAIWARNGIESVNLSAGYQFEHTSDEELDVAACYRTYQYLMEILGESPRLWRGLRGWVGLVNI